jgi:arylsulfatase
LQAHEQTIAHYRGKYKKLGWDKVREKRFERLKKSGIISADSTLAPRPARVPAWENASPEEKEKWDNEMAIYAAQIEELDDAIGRVLKSLKQTGRDKNTLVIFLSDNGGAAEDPNRSSPGAKLGTRESYEGYGLIGATVSCTPFRKTKKYTHEGGISTPFIVSWPEGIAKSQRGKLDHEAGTILDLMPTFLKVANAELPKEMNGGETTPLEGIDLARSFTGKKLSRPNPIFWEHEGQRAVRNGKWKLVASHDEPWELYDMETDRTELHDVSKSKPEITRELIAKYEAWTKRVDAKPWPFPAKKPAPPKK